MSTRYARQVALADVGAEGQAKLGRARVLVVGLGGLGCPAALYLGTSGVGRLVLNDFDRVDETNLPRQILFGPDDVGALKVEAAKKRLLALNPELDVVCVTERLDAAALEAAVAAVDIVLDGTDNFTTRFAVNRACVARRVPLYRARRCGSKARSQCFRCKATARATRASTTTRTSGSAIARVTACSHPFLESSAR